MSADTKTTLDAAIAAHISDEVDGAIITGYILHAAYLNVDTDERGTTGYFAEFAENQPFHVGYGLAHQMIDHFQHGFDDDE